MEVFRSQMFSSFHSSAISRDKKLVPQSVSMFFGIPTWANITKSTFAMVVAVVKCNGAALGYQVA